MEAKKGVVNLQISIDRQLAPNFQVSMHFECPLDLEFAEDFDFVPVFKAWLVVDPK